jgi:pyruvate formate lyase activating enzyme
VDMVAMDVKGSKSLYPLVTSVHDFDTAKIDRCLTILKQGAVEYEIRTTVIPQVIDIQAVSDIVTWIGPVWHYVLQQFRPVMTLDARYRYLEPLPEADLMQMAEIARKVIPNVSIRGLAF